MTYSISKDFAFAAAHRLTGLAPSHPCSRLHGHNYLVRLTLASERTDPTGFVIDYRDLAPFADHLDELLDHRTLNDVYPHINPTAENLALLLYEAAASLLDLPPGAYIDAVAVAETPKTWATYTP